MHFDIDRNTFKYILRADYLCVIIRETSLINYITRVNGHSPEALKHDSFT